MTSPGRFFPRRLLLDAGAVIGLTRGDHRVRAWLGRAVEDDLDVVIPAVVIAETTRGGSRDAIINRLIAGASVSDADEAIARSAGRLLAAAASDATIDALVIAEAPRSPATIVLTSDPDDLDRLNVGNPDVAIERL